jgi:hypothetical protein
MGAILCWLRLDDDRLGILANVPCLPLIHTVALARCPRHTSHASNRFNGFFGTCVHSKPLKRFQDSKLTVNTGLKPRCE